MNYVYHNLQIFLINLFFVFILFFLYHKFIEKRINQQTKEVLVGLISGLSIILCMTFPFSPTAGWIFDMRQVPFIIGALYGGRRVALFLLVVLVTYRLYISVDHGFYASLIIYTFILIGLWFAIPIFNRANQIKLKVLIALIVSILGFLFMAVVIYSFSPSISIKDIFLLFLLYSTQYFGIALFINIIEKTRMNLLILDELRTLEKLKIVSEIAASISHEVRNPLTVTRGFIQLLRESNLSAEQKNLYITLSLTELDRAEHIITDYLTFAKPSLENTQLIELNHELDYILKVLTPYATMRNVQIEVVKEQPIRIIGEAQKLHQCLINIIKNGIEAMEQGGPLTIELKKTMEKAVIIVQDAGKGMDPEQISRLGTPYYSTKEKGTGLGTMVVFSIIKLMRGEIEVDSELGKGTRFTISIPLANCPTKVDLKLMNES